MFYNYANWLYWLVPLETQTETQTETRAGFSTCFGERRVKALEHYDMLRVSFSIVKTKEKKKLVWICVFMVKYRYMYTPLVHRLSSHTTDTGICWAWQLWKRCMNR